MEYMIWLSVLQIALLKEGLIAAFSNVKKEKHFILYSQNFISTYRYLDDHCQ